MSIYILLKLNWIKQNILFFIIPTLKLSTQYSTSNLTSCFRSVCLSDNTKLLITLNTISRIYFTHNLKSTREVFDTW